MTTERVDAGREGADAETTYRVSVDLNACDGVFACLVRDDRFVEADGGLVGFDPADAVAPVERAADEVAATFCDERIDEAQAAAAACPLDAITVEEREGDA
jgi:ferredoxin